MKVYIILISFLTVSCYTGSPDIEILRKIQDSKGQTRTLIFTGHNPGEDAFLHIIKYDSNGNTTEAYGVKSGGHKYKQISKYDQHNRLIELTFYTFEKIFENYKIGTERYTLADTLTDFSVTNEDIDSRMVFQFNDSSGGKRELHYRAVVDSLTNHKRLEIAFDTIW